uniref:Glycosyltransferase family 2 protein n=1 Tax=Haemonchus placei TaxID=6290 RepID=A0A0N4WXP3_HAEPC
LVRRLCREAIRTGITSRYRLHWNRITPFFWYLRRILGSM